MSGTEKCLCQSRAGIGKLSTKDSLVVEEPSGSEGEVGEEAVHTEGEVLLQLRIGILHISLHFRFSYSQLCHLATFPIKFRPLIPECEAMSLQAVLVHLEKKFFHLSSLNVVLVPAG